MLYAHLSFSGRDSQVDNKQPKLSHVKQLYDSLQFWTEWKDLMTPESIHFVVRD